VPPTSRLAVLNLQDARPVWRAPDAVLQRIAAAFPADWRVEIVSAPSDGRGDGGAAPAEAIAAARDAEVYIGSGVPAEIVRAAGSALRWAHTATAGVGSLLHDEMLRSTAALTNSAAVHAPAIAETAIAMALHFARGLDHAVRAQQRREWDPLPFENATDGSIFELSGSTLGVIGLGGIGRELAARANALGMRVLATRRSDRAGPHGVEILRGPDALDRLLERSHIVAVTVPSTRETRGLLDRTALERMRAGAVLINVARGDIIDESALVERLRAGALRGAALDVYEREPLPPDSPLRDLPNVLLLPHVSGTTTRFWEREEALILENIDRYLSNRPLQNLVDKNAGY
jgi:phosphoglycerate dehydrogenase-like enzyme